jgi:hypothetical protein
LRSHLGNIPQTEKGMAIEDLAGIRPSVLDRWGNVVVRFCNKGPFCIMGSRESYTSGAQLYVSGIQGIDNLAIYGNPLGVTDVIDCRGDPSKGRRGKKHKVKLPEGVTYHQIPFNRLCNASWDSNGKPTNLVNIGEFPKWFRPIYKMLSEGKSVVGQTRNTCTTANSDVSQQA